MSETVVRALSGDGSESGSAGTPKGSSFLSSVVQQLNDWLDTRREARRSTGLERLPR